jgi:hypothetical protein
MPTGEAAWPTLTRSAAALSSGQWAVTRAHQAQLVQQASSRQVAALVLTVIRRAGRRRIRDARITSPVDSPGRQNDHRRDTRPARHDRWHHSAVVGQQRRPAHDASLQDSQVTDSASFAGTFSVIALAVLLTITGMVTRWTLDKRRMAAWDADGGEPDRAGRPGHNPGISGR